VITVGITCHANTNVLSTNTTYNRAGVLDDNLVVAPPVTRLNLNKYPGYDPDLVEDHTRVPLPAPAAADMKLLPLISSVCEAQNVPFLYELPLAVLSRKFEHEVVPQRFGLLLSAELDTAILVRVRLLFIQHL
jgi:hypothetical protein